MVMVSIQWLINQLFNKPKSTSKFCLNEVWKKILIASIWRKNNYFLYQNIYSVPGLSTKCECMILTFWLVTFCSEIIILFWRWLIESNEWLDCFRSFTYCWWYFSQWFLFKIEKLHLHQFYKKIIRSTCVAICKPKMFHIKIEH